jgi:hypothetical protein
MRGRGDAAEEHLTAKFAKKGREERKEEQDQKYVAVLRELRETLATFAVKIAFTASSRPFQLSSFLSSN